MKKNHKTVLTEEQVRQIKNDPRLWIYGGVAQIAREYGVSNNVISFIKHGRTWKNI